MGTKHRHIQNNKVLWISIKDATDDNTARWIRSFNRVMDQIQEPCRMFVVCSQSLDDIRELIVKSILLVTHSTTPWH